MLAFCNKVFFALQFFLVLYLLEQQFVLFVTLHKLFYFFIRQANFNLTGYNYVPFVTNVSFKYKKSKLR